MKKLFVISLMVMCTSAFAVAQHSNYPISPIPFTSVKITPESFWGQRLEASRNVTVPLAFSKCEETGRYHNFELAALQLAGKGDENYQVEGLPFDDTDVYKTIEGCSYLLQTYPKLTLPIQRGGRTDIVPAKAYMDSVLSIVKTAQEKDGYLYTARTINPKLPHSWSQGNRWEQVEINSHEFYDLGHMVEGAIAHYQATGEKTFLDIARRYADCVIREIGQGAGQRDCVPGHQIAEMALAKLYLVTGEKRYLDQAKYFLDRRGYTTNKAPYTQSHLPVIEQDEAVGHAVRASYMYAGIADVAALTGDSAYIKAIDLIWKNIVEKKYYITGGIGATAIGEAFGQNYELPNMSAYCETCAAIGNVYVNHRLFLLHGESKYYDVLERTLYNALIAGISLDGGAFFYPNPLESRGQHLRQPWFGCACCPSNVCRFIPSLPGYIYQTCKQKDDSNKSNVYVNLFVSNKADVKLPSGGSITLSQETQYPWKGDITLKMEKANNAFALNIRIPGWVRNQVVPSHLYEYVDETELGYTLSVNGTPINVAPNAEGYAVIDRKWKKGDQVEIHFDMEPRIVKANNKVEADRKRISIERGPIVYCAEFADNTNVDLHAMIVGKNPKFEVKQSELCYEKDGKSLKWGLDKLTTTVQEIRFSEEGLLDARKVNLTLIPYYAWNHRGAGNMMVWLPQSLADITPVNDATIAGNSKIEASVVRDDLSAINDGICFPITDERSIPYYHWWPKNDSQEWITYTFQKETKVSSCTLYWYDDKQIGGGCAIPSSWEIQYQDANGKWQPVAVSEEGYPIEKGTGCTVSFTAIKTKALKLNVTLPKNDSAGIYEWEVE